MNYKFQYQNETDRQSILDNNKDKTLIEEDNLMEGDFLIFSDIVPFSGTLQEIQANKVAQMDDFCGQTIVTTFQSKAFDGITLQPYDCQLTDQARINGLVSVATLVKIGASTEPIAYKNSNQPLCVPWTADQMLMLGLDLKRHVEKNTDKYEALKVYINKLATIDAVNAVTFDMTIPV